MFNAQSGEVLADYFAAVSRLENGEILTMPRSRNLSSIYKGLYELRLKDASGQYRFFYFIKRGEAIYMLHAIKKKTQELPKREVEIVLKRIKEV
ncbi:MAG: type II toxin-antitoxin system RelE/ParE family toxin [Deltaproteobacteria bacterium]|nr:type II toxin-antitoxin system RelE/ParE family toxin [Deltaproteobacteria bacterium]